MKHVVFFLAALFSINNIFCQSNRYYSIKPEVFYKYDFSLNKNQTVFGGNVLISNYFNNLRGSTGIGIVKDFSFYTAQPNISTNNIVKKEFETVHFSYPLMFGYRVFDKNNFEVQIYAGILFDNVIAHKTKTYYSNKPDATIKHYAINDFNTLLTSGCVLSRLLKNQQIALNLTPFFTYYLNLPSHLDYYMDFPQLDFKKRISIGISAGMEFFLKKP